MSDWYWRDGTRVEGPQYPEPGWKDTMLAVESKLADFNYKVVEQTLLPDGKFVSTVWLGLNHGRGAGLPLIFETMVFPTQSDLGELEVRRYATEAEARVGHAAMVARHGGAH